MCTPNAPQKDSLIQKTAWIPFALLGIGLLSFVVALMMDIIGKG
jgi:hypothetical protein